MRPQNGRMAKGAPKTIRLRGAFQSELYGGAVAERKKKIVHGTVTYHCIKLLKSMCSVRHFSDWSRLCFMASASFPAFFRSWMLP